MKSTIATAVFSLCVHALGGAAAVLAVGCSSSPDGKGVQGNAAAGGATGGGGVAQSGAASLASGGATAKGGAENGGSSAGSGGAVSGGMNGGSGGLAGTGGKPVSGGAAGTSNGGGGATAMAGAAGTAGTMGACTPNTGCMPAAPSTGDMYADCVARVNQFRACVCLPPLQRWMDGEACANQDASYDAQNQSAGAHAAFKARICASGNAQDECPGWRSSDQVVSGCLQQMFNEGPAPTNPCDDTCYQQHGHYINMTNTHYTMIACGFYTASDGKVWSVQNFK